MGYGARIFLVEDDDSLRRLSQARLKRLMDRNPDELLPAYAGKCVRCALATLETKDRKPAAILDIHYIILQFDSRGMLDKKSMRRNMRMGSELVVAMLSEKSTPEVIDARYKFSKARYDREFKWKPSPKIEEAIVEAIFRRGKQSW